jgi:hypothetical protein
MKYKCNLNNTIVEAFQTPFDINILDGVVYRAFKGDWVIKYQIGQIGVISDNTIKKYFELVDGPIND